jgi:hypothetical protein
MVFVTYFVQFLGLRKNVWFSYSLFFKLESSFGFDFFNLVMVWNVGFYFFNEFFVDS